MIERFIVGLSLRVAVYTAGFVLEAFLETPRCCDQPWRSEHPKTREYAPAIRRAIRRSKT
jgi:hypothetical protein